MILYHGSNTAFNVIDLGKGLPAKDFGRGFYLTDSLECAEKTARQRVARLGGAPRFICRGHTAICYNTRRWRNWHASCNDDE